jgi:hypothetical protein
VFSGLRPSRRDGRRRAGRAWQADPSNPRRRNYSQKKLTENVEAEIMQVILDEARESYAEEIVLELSSDTLEALEANVQRILQFIAAFKPAA